MTTNYIGILNKSQVDPVKITGALSGTEEEDTTDVQTITSKTRLPIIPEKEDTDSSDDEKSSISSASSGSSKSSASSGKSSFSEKRKKQEKDNKYKALSKDGNREIINRINRFKHYDGFKVPELKGTESTSELLKIWDELKYEQKYKSNVKFFRTLIAFLGWVMEMVCVKIGFSSMAEFSNQINYNLSEFDEFYDELTEPVWERNENDEYVKTDKTNIFAMLDKKTEYRLVMKLVTMASLYSAANKLEIIAEKIAD